MYYGAHSYIFTDRWTDDMLEVLETARELGLDCLEIAVGDDVVFDAPRVRHHAATQGVNGGKGTCGQWPHVFIGAQRKRLRQRAAKSPQRAARSDSARDVHAS